MRSLERLRSSISSRVEGQMLLCAVAGTVEFERGTKGMLQKTSNDKSLKSGTQYSSDEGKEKGQSSNREATERTE